MPLLPTRCPSDDTDRTARVNQSIVASMHSNFGYDLGAGVDIVALVRHL